MRLGFLGEELDDITRSYDYGIVPGSATVFVKDELNNIGRLDLTLLEGVMIVVEVSGEGYKVASCSPLSSTGTTMATAQTVQQNLEVPFESMVNLLMAISPMFRERFQQALYDKLEIVHRHQTATTTTTTTTTPIDQAPLLQQKQQQQNQLKQQQQQQQTAQSASDLVEQALAQDVFNDLQSWIH